MSRIRSVHPGLFTDEAFMTASAMARLLMIGLWTEAWDDGVFEWKPVVLKARLFPADLCDVSELLAELERLNVIKKIEQGGKSYGLVRNFRKFQRPKKPNRSPIDTKNYADFLGPEPISSEPVPNQFRTSSEIAPQMEDGGWRMEEETTSSFHSDVVGGPKPAPAKPPKIDRKKSGKFDPRKALSAHGCDPKHVDGWLEVRKAKRAPLTAAALDRLQSEADKANVSIADAVKICAERGWQSFDASWKFDRPQSTADPPKQVFLTPEDHEWSSWVEYRRRIGAPRPAPISTSQDRKGYWFPTRLPPQTQEKAS